MTSAREVSTISFTEEISTVSYQEQSDNMIQPRSI